MRCRRSSSIVAGACAGLLVLASAAPASVPPPAAAAYAADRADRHEKQKKALERLRRDKAKIDQAIVSTRTLIDRSRDRPYLGDLYLRLAELTIEKSRVVYFIRLEETPPGTKSLEHLESDALKRDAIEIYQRILSHFPDFASQDKVRFFLAHEYRELGQIDDMLAQYREIVTRYPGGPYAPESYLLLGDHFFNTKDLELARRHYEAVLRYAESPAVTVARYKLAWCCINEADWKGAIALLEQAVTTPDAQREIEIDTYRKVDIKLESLVDMAYCYGEQYKDATPEEAVRYFERHAWSRPVLSVALEKLAQRYFVKKKWQHAAHVYRTLSALRNDPEKLLEYAGRVFECVRATGTFDRADEDMALIVKALERQRYSIHIAEDVKARNLKEYELYGRDIVTHLHRKALEENATDAFRLAASAYRRYLDFFDASEVRGEMQRNFAEVLFAGREFLEAGKEYEKAAKAKGSREKEREDSLYAAVLSYYSALKEKDRLNAHGRVFARAGLRATGAAYAAAYPKSEKVPNVLFNVAWVAYEEGDYETAIREFSQFVEAYPARSEAAAAVHLILDAYALREDYEGLTRFGSAVLRNTALDDGLRREVATIVRAAESKVIAPLAVAAAQDWGTGKRRLREFAEEHRSTSLGEQALQALVASSARARDLPALFGAAADLLGRTSSAERAEETLNLLIDTCVHASEFRQLALSLEEFARRLPQKPSSPEFLGKAAQIREALAQYDRAAADYEAALASHAPGSSERAELAFKAAENALLQSDPERALRVLLDDEASLAGAARARADARIATVYLRRGEAERAEPFRRRARTLWEKDLPEGGPAAGDAVAEMEMARLTRLLDEFRGLTLGGQVDDEVVRRKGELLDRLLDGYHEVIGFQRPRWALAACFRAHEVHEEFARFLENAPVPDLSEEERVEYGGLVKEKVDAHRLSGAEYLAKCRELAQRWELCDPELAAYVGPASGGAAIRGFSDAPPAPSDGTRWLVDDALRSAHASVLEGPDDGSRAARLARAYVDIGDPRQAVLVAQKALDDVGDGNPKRKASLANTLGVAYLSSGRDELAKAAFEQALQADPENPAPRINLAALLRHYGHVERSEALYDELPAPMRPAERGDLVHPHSQELYDARHGHARK